MKACTTLKNSVQNSQTNTQGCNKQDSQNVAHKTVKERQYKEDKVWASHAIITFGQHTRSNDIGRGIPSSPLGSTDGRTTSAWHVIIAFVRQTRSNDVGHGVPASPLCSTHGRTTSGVACHHRLWAAHTVGRRRALHAIIALGQHRRLDDFGRGMPSSPLDSTDGGATSSVS